MPNKVDYRTFSQRVKNKYPEYINMGDLELAQMWVEQNPQYGEFVMFDQQPVKKKDQVAPSLGAQGGLPSQQPSVQPRRTKEERFFGGAFGDALDLLDRPAFMTGIPGGGLGIGDFIDDMGRAFFSGKKAGVNISTSRPLFFSGPGSSDEEVQNFVKAGTEYTGPSDEATQFYKDYEDNGKTTFGFVKALAKNPGIAPELVVQSASQLLFNPEARAAFGTSIAAGAGIGAAATAPLGGIGAAPGAMAAILPGVAAANMAVSTLSSFSELMKQELDQRGLEFNEDNVRTILEDEKALRRIRAKSAGYGITIGAFDLATAKVGGAIAAKIPMTTKAGRIKSTLSTTGVEAVGGSAGEAAARGVTGQELDPAEIGLEGIAETPGAAPTLLSQVLKRPAYKINGEFVGQADVDDILQNSTRQELENTKFEVFNDVNTYGLKFRNRIDELKTRDAVIEANPNASNQEIDLLVGLNTKLKNLNEMDAESAKIAAETIRSEIKAIQKNLLQREISPETEQQAEQIVPEAPQMAPAEVSPEVGMEIPQPQESVLEAPKMPPLEDLEFDNIEFVEPVITPVETQLVGEKKSPLIKETFQGVTRPRRKPGEARAPLMEQVTEGGVFKAKLRDSKTGTEFIVEDPELSLDLAIAAQVMESGRAEFPQPAFLEAFSEVVDSDPELQTLFPNISETGQPLSLEQRTVSLDGKKVTRNVVQRMQPLYAALEQRMNNAEEIPMSEIESVVDQVIQLQQEIQNQKGTKTVRAANGVRQEFTPLTDEQKRIFNDFTDALVNKLLSYDFATTTTTGPATQKTTTAGLIATPREGRPLPEARVQRERLEGAEVTIEGRGRGRITIKPLPGLGERSVYGITFEETGAVAPETISPTARETGTTPAAVGVEPQTEQDVRQETNAPQEGRGQGEDAAPVPQEEGRQEGQVTPPAVVQEGETPPATAKEPTKQSSKQIAEALQEAQKENADKFVNDFANIDIPFRQENIQAEMDGEVKKRLFPNEKTRRKYAENVYSAVVRSSVFPKILSEAYVQAKADGSNPELVKAVDELLGKKTAPTTEQVETTTTKKPRKTAQEKTDEGKAIVETLKETLRALKAKPGGGANIDLTFGVVPITKAVWNTAIDTAILAIDAGQSIAQAVKAASDYISSKIDGDWGKAKFGQYMEDLLTEASGMIKERVSYTPFPEGLGLADGWYSTIEKRIREAKQDKQSASAWLNSGLIGKGDEATYTGVRGWLEGKKPNEAVSKQEILDWMNDNRVEIVEVVKGSKYLPNYTITNEVPSEFGANKNDLLGALSAAETLDNPRFEQYLENRYGKGKEILSWLKENTKETGTYLKEETTKFGQYQLEGEKENYKEVLVTLPPPKAKTPLTFKEEDGLWNVYRDGKKILEGVESLEEAKDLVDFGIDSDITSSGQDISKIFQSTHFDEPNVLVHLRINTRTDADGNKVLFLEEVQSDWGQEGKKKGFAKPANVELINKLEQKKQDVLNGSKSYQFLNDRTDGDLDLDVFDAIQQIATNMIDNKYSTNESRKKRFLEEFDSTMSYWKTYNSVPRMSEGDLSNFYDIYIQELKNNDIKDRSGNYYKLESVKNKIDEINSDIFDAGKKSGSPTAPFVTDTNAWTKLAVKIAMREAAKQGVDKIAWTTGEQQNDRYDLSKQINAASAIKNNDGTYNLIVEDKQGNEIDPYSRSGKKVTPQEMEDTVGKDLAQKLIDGADRNAGKEWKKNMPVNPEFYTVSGVDLKVGGKGMRGFYDKIVPDAFKSVVKELTGQDAVIGETALNTPEKTIQQSIPLTTRLKGQIERGMPLFEGEKASVQQRAEKVRGDITKATEALTQAQPQGVEGLSGRLTGDALLDAQDLSQELIDNEADVDNDGMVTVYHRTTPENKIEIERSGKMVGLEDGLFFSTKESGQAEGYGNSIVKLKVPVEKLTLDDTFGNEAHVRIATSRPNQSVDVSSYLSQAKTKPEAKQEKTIAEKRKEFRETAKKYFEGMKKMGVIFDAERNAAEDIAFIKALTKYIKLEIDNGMVTFKGFIEKTAGMIEDFNDNSVKRIARDIWSKEVVKAYPKLYAKLQKAEKTLLEQEIARIRKEKESKLSALLSPKALYLEQDGKLKKRRISMEAAELLSEMKKSVGNVKELGNEELIQYVDLGQQIFKTGRAEAIELRKANELQAKTNKEKTLLMITDNGKRESEVIESRMEGNEEVSALDVATEVLKDKVGSVIVEFSNGEVYVYFPNQIADFKSDMSKDGALNEVRTFRKVVTSDESGIKNNLIRRQMLSAMGSLNLLVELLKGKSKASIDWANNVNLWLSDGANDLRKNEGSFNRIDKENRLASFGKVVFSLNKKKQGGYVQWGNRIAKMNGKNINLLSAAGQKTPITKAITNDALLNYYSQILNPKMLSGGASRKINLDNNSINTILQYMSLPENAQALDYVRLTSNHYENVRKKIIPILESQGYSTDSITRGKLDIDKAIEEDPTTGRFLRRAYDLLRLENDPNEALYFPSSVEPEKGAELDITTDDLMSPEANNQKALSALSNNLISTTEGGKLIAKGFSESIKDYNKSMANMIGKLGVLNNMRSSFNAENMKAMSNIFGKAYSDRFRERVRYYFTQIPAGYNGKALRAPEWFTIKTSLPMFFNRKSGILQTLQTLAFIPKFGFKNYYDGIRILQENGGIQTPRGMKYRIGLSKEILQNELVQARIGARFDISVRDLNELVRGDDKSIVIGGVPFTLKKLLSVGYLYSTGGDLGSILTGGMPVYAKLRQDYINQYSKTMSAEEAGEKGVQKALTEFADIIDKTQQTSREDLLAAFETDPTSRLLLSFATIIPQSTRMAIVAGKRIQIGEGNIYDNVAQIAYFGLLSSVFFNLISQGLDDLFDPEEEDETNRRKKIEALKKISLDVIRDLTKSFGWIGVAAQATVVAAKKVDEGLERGSSGKQIATDVAIETVSMVPQISIIRRDMEGLGRAVDMDQMFKATTIGVQLVTNVPAENTRKMFQDFADIATQQYTISERLMRSMGILNETWAESKSFEDIWQGKPGARERLTPARISALRKIKVSEYRKTLDGFAEEYSEAKTQAEKDAIDSRAMSLIDEVFKAKDDGVGESNTLYDYYEKKLNYYLKPKDVRKVIDMNSEERKNYIEREYRSILKKDGEISADAYILNLYEYEAISQNEFDEIYIIINRELGR